MHFKAVIFLHFSKRNYPRIWKSHSHKHQLCLFCLSKYWFLIQYFNLEILDKDARNLSFKLVSRALWWRKSLSNCISEIQTRLLILSFESRVDFIKLRGFQVKISQIKRKCKEIEFFNRSIVTLWTVFDWWTWDQ